MELRYASWSFDMLHGAWSVPADELESVARTSIQSCRHASMSIGRHPVGGNHMDSSSIDIGKSNYMTWNLEPGEGFGPWKHGHEPGEGVGLWKQEAGKSPHGLFFPNSLPLIFWLHIDFQKCFKGCVLGLSDEDQAGLVVLSILMACKWESWSGSRREIIPGVEIHGQRLVVPSFMIRMARMYESGSMISEKESLGKDRRMNSILDAPRGFNAVGVASCLVLELYLDLWQGDIQHVCLGCTKSHPRIWRLGGFFVQGPGGWMNFSSRDPGAKWAFRPTTRRLDGLSPRNQKAGWTFVQGPEGRMDFSSWEPRAEWAFRPITRRMDGLLPRNQKAGWTFVQGLEGRRAYPFFKPEGFSSITQKLS
ncbi:hypothetical protein Rs2_28485 [Raphanus sativus]|nr:hypothetical protein Rs2_28485 [Raphanus sativus]